MTDQSPAPLTRRQLRESATRTTRPRVTDRPRRTTSTPPSPATGDAPLTRRAIREAERAACAPPFAALIRLPLPSGHRRPSAGAVAKSGVLVALSGALVMTSVSGFQDASTGVDGFALRAAADRAALEDARLAEAARDRADAAASSRLSGAAAAYATARRAEAVAAAEAALATATQVTSQVEPVVGSAELQRLVDAAAQVSALVAEAQAPPARLDDVAAQAVAAGAVDLATAGTIPVDDEQAALGARAEARVDGEQPASRASRGTAPTADATDAPASTGRADDANATTSTDPTAVPDATSPTVPPTPLVAPEPEPAATPVPAAVTGPDPAALAAEANAALQQVDALLDAAAGLDAVVAEVSRTAAAVVAQQEAERKAAEELARKVAAAEAAGNGNIPSDLLCAPAFAPDARLRCDAAEALERLNAAYRADHGRDLDVVSSYRSYSMQVSTRASRGSLAATPGTSNHGHGIAVDLGGFGGVGQFSDPDYLWMREHAGAYGWYHPSVMRPGGGGPQEPWHWEFGTEE